MDKSKKPITYRKRDEGGYHVRVCVVPHGRDTHWDSECGGGSGQGHTEPVEIQSLTSRHHLRTERLWTAISGYTGERVALVGDDGQGNFYTRQAAAEALRRHGESQWAAR